jgi:glutamine amidotransferase
LSTPNVAIVDYGLGNLFSVARACEHTGMRGFVTSSNEEMASADAVILPGVGAFGDAMASLGRLDLVAPLRELAAASKPLIGICLGMQLLLSQSTEFGRHEGLGIIEGSVRRLSDDSRSPISDSTGGPLKVPQVGWNRVLEIEREEGDASQALPVDPLLRGLPQGVFMYFVHSYVVEPADPSVVTRRSRYGGIDFCSALRSGNVVGFQFHPERSGEHGLTVYRNLASWLSER